MGRFRVMPVPGGLAASFEPLSVDDVLEAFDTVEGMTPGVLEGVTFNYSSVRLLVEELRRLRRRIPPGIHR